MNKDLVIIAGGGKFGKIALDYVKKRKFITLLIDENPHCYASQFVNIRVENINEFFIQLDDFKEGDLIFLEEDISIIFYLLIKITPKYIIPVVPIHLMALLIQSFFIVNSLNIEYDIHSTHDFINKIDKSILLSFNEQMGLVCLSYAKNDEICPDNCSGPRNYCPNFKREKPMTITDYLKNHFEVSNGIKIVQNNHMDLTLIIESIQLSPGLGGIEGEILRDILYTLINNLNSFIIHNFRIKVATTCNCHGVIHFFMKG